MSEIVREMTLREEIEALSIDDKTKQRLLSKLEEYDYEQEEHNVILVKQCEEMHSRIVPLEEVNAALMNACEGLAQAVVAQRRVRHE